MVSLDEPAHKRLRTPAMKAFTPKRVAEMEPVIRGLTVDLLDAVDHADPFDAVDALTFPLPAITIFSLMGVPERDWQQMKQWCGSRASLGWGKPGPEEQVEVATAMVAYRRYLRELVAGKATRPSDDLASALVAIHHDDPDELTLEEAASILFLWSFAGHEMTNNPIANTIRRLLEHRPAWTPWWPTIATSAQSTIPVRPSVPVWRRAATRHGRGRCRDTGRRRICGWRPPGDPKGSAADWSDIPGRRPPSSGFREGHSFLPGASLAKLEVRVAIEELATRFPSLALVADQQLTYHPNISFRGPRHLWVTQG
jgi:cytochrome P450